MNARISPSCPGEVDLYRRAVIMKRRESSMQRPHLDWIIGVVLRDCASFDHCVEEDPLDCTDIWLAGSTVSGSCSSERRSYAQLHSITASPTEPEHESDLSLGQPGSPARRVRTVVQRFVVARHRPTTTLPRRSCTAVTTCPRDLSVLLTVPCIP
jgi:hypothetical protein